MISIKLARLIALLPIGSLRRWAYGRLYRIAPSARIGFGTVIAVRSFECGPDVIIGRWNRFSGDVAIKIGRGSRIEDSNRFVTNVKRNSESDGKAPKENVISLGEECLVTSKQFLDGDGSITFGDRAWLAGLGSQIWTHGLQVRDCDVVVGQDCYIGSGTMIAPGSRLPDGSIVSLGSVVLNKFAEKHALIQGNPAECVKIFTAEEWAARYRHSFSNW